MLKLVQKYTNSLYYIHKVYTFFKKKFSIQLHASKSLSQINNIFYNNSIKISAFWQQYTYTNNVPSVKFKIDERINIQCHIVEKVEKIYTRLTLNSDILMKLMML